MSNTNRKAVLDTIAWSEGTSHHPLTVNDGYDVIVTGLDSRGRIWEEVFTDYSQHPFTTRAPKKINAAGLESTASGRYQILRRFWLIEMHAHHYPSFEKPWQDEYVMQQFRERSALALLDMGRFDAAITAISGLWASLPGKAYVGQHQHTFDALLSVYQAAGGLLSAALPLPITQGP